MEVSRYTLLSRRREKIAKSAVWFAVILTLCILAWIILYVLIRGFVSNQERIYDVSQLAEESIRFGNRGQYEMSLIVNKKVRVHDLTKEELRRIYTKSRQENWGHYSLQDIKVVPFAISEETPFGKAAAGFVSGSQENIADYVAFLSDPEEVVQRVSESRGGIGYVPADTPIKNKDVKVVPLRRIALAVHPGVKAVKNNIQLLTIRAEDLNGIISGEVTNWQELGGHDVPIRLVLFSSDNRAHAGIYEYLESSPADASNTLSVASFGEFAQEINRNDGAAGLCFYDEAVEAGLPLMEISRKEVRGNLTIPFLLEAPARSGKWGGISTIIINTLFLILFTLLFAAPVGVLAAIYLVEYAGQGPFVSILRMGTETLAGIPSIIFGLFGNIFFVNILGMGIGFISSTLTVAMMILPTIIRTSEEALKAVPVPLREGSLALGATKLQTVFRVVLPSAIPGILTGLILGLGRVVGESAVLLYTLGSNYELVRGPSSSARVLSLHLYFLFSEAISFDRAFATGAVLIFIVILVNYSTTKLISRAGRMSGNV